MLCYVMLCCVVSCRVVSCRVVSCRVMSCRVVSCRVVSCHVMSYHIYHIIYIIYHIISYHIVSYQKEIKCKKVVEEDADIRSLCRKSSTGTCAFLKQLCDNLTDLSVLEVFKLNDNNYVVKRELRNVCKMKVKQPAVVMTSRIVYVSCTVRIILINN